MKARFTSEIIDQNIASLPGMIVDAIEQPMCAGVDLINCIAATFDKARANPALLGKWVWGLTGVLPQMMRGDVWFAQWTMTRINECVMPDDKDAFADFAGKKTFANILDRNVAYGYFVSEPSPGNGLRLFATLHGPNRRIEFRAPRLTRNEVDLAKRFDRDF